MTKSQESIHTMDHVDDHCKRYHAVFPNVGRFGRLTRPALGLVT